jgi:hypothetical protein
MIKHLAAVPVPVVAVCQLLRLVLRAVRFLGRAGNTVIAGNGG